MSIIGFLVGPIINGVLKGMAEMQKAQLHEDMQAEILEGWIFKIKIAVERELKASEVTHEVYLRIMEGIDKVVEEEFDTKRI